MYAEGQPYCARNWDRLSDNKEERKKYLASLLSLFFHPSQDDLNGKGGLILRNGGRPESFYTSIWIGSIVTSHNVTHL